MPERTLNVPEEARKSAVMDDYKVSFRLLPLHSQSRVYGEHVQCRNAKLDREDKVFKLD